MGDDQLLVIGTEFAPWQIKDFSVNLRKAITQAAHKQEVTVAEWVHAYFARHGMDGLEVLTRQVLPGQPASTDDALLTLAQLARALTPPDRDSAAMRLARSIVRERLKALLAPTEPAVPPIAPANRALSAPKPRVELARSS